ncbi:rsbT co-antagonist protein RsbR [Alteribacillus persepolensis]|uniref:RsbT co-antagonist protein RsbR n=1 Tax=Alteribacillus persepolensis TaxID=568899 RepID=A0A1G8FGA0_9BACI|nr:STAS domain-containing protein [Alteribacillus persepolensis]SDH81096.1 rsbT co-antagonist protein RsbR [Alteribacillus persepolensis]
MQPSIIEMIYSQREEIMKRWEEEVQRVSENEMGRQLPYDKYNETNAEFIHLIIDTLELDQNEAKEKLRFFAERLIHAGWPLSYFTQGMQAFRRVLLETMTSNDSLQSKTVFTTFYEIESWIDGIINQLVDEYTGSWENTLHLQKLALKELSAPLIPVFEKISVMPLIGTIDTERAKLIMESLLEGIIEHRSQVVLIDITGVPVVDTMVAHHIIQASEAVRLVGAECILVGIRPEIAQTIVNLGIDLGKFPTRSTLRKGIETGLELTQRKIVDI